MPDNNMPQGSPTPNWRPSTQQTTPMNQTAQYQQNTQYQQNGQNPQQGAQGVPGAQGNQQSTQGYQGAPQRPQVPPYQTNYSTATMPPNPTTSQNAQHTHKRKKWRSSKSGGSNGSGSTSRAKTFWLAFLGAALACVVAFACFGIYNSTSGRNVSGSTVLGATTNTTINASDDNEDRAEAVSNKVLPSVVSIQIYSNQGQDSLSSIFGGGSSSSDSNMTETALGSGVIISQDGYILTNNHVVEGADALRVTANGQEYDATVVGTDPTSDLAVVKIDANDLTPIEIGDSSNLQQGQWVMTVGSPFGLEQSVATGIVSATSRTVAVDNSDSSSSYTSSSEPSIYSNMIQTDAAINPGNSGGALVDQNGKLIGINAVIESYSGNYSGVGFAIPVNYAMNIAQQIIQGKTPTHAQLGLTATTVTSEIAQRYNLDAQQGAYVSSVTSGSGAAEAGLQDGDIITAINNTQVTSVTDLIGAVRSYNVGDTVTVTYVRDGQTQTAEVQLSSDNGGTSSSSSSNNSNSNRGYGQNNGNSGRGYGYGY